MSPRQQVRAAALAQAARTAAAQGGLAQVFASGLSDPRIAQAFLANGGTPEALATVARMYDGLHNGIYGAVGDELANATNHNEGSAPAALRAATFAAVTAAAARSGAPVNYVMPNGSIYHGTAGSAPAGAQPLVSTDEGKAAIIQHDLLPQPGGAVTTAAPAAAPVAEREVSGRPLCQSIGNENDHRAESVLIPGRTVLPRVAGQHGRCGGGELAEHSRANAAWK